MILKSLSAATFTCLAVMTFSANAASLAGTTMTLDTKDTGALWLDYAPALAALLLVQHIRSE